MLQLSTVLVSASLRTKWAMQCLTCELSYVQVLCMLCLRITSHSLISVLRTCQNASKKIEKSAHTSCPTCLLWYSAAPVLHNNPSTVWLQYTSQGSAGAVGGRAMARQAGALHNSDTRVPHTLRLNSCGFTLGWVQIQMQTFCHTTEAAPVPHMLGQRFFRDVPQGICCLAPI